MPRVTFMTKSQVTKGAKAGSMFVDQAIEDVQTTMKLSKGMAKTDTVAVAALFLSIDLCTEGIVHRFKSGYDQDKAVRCVRDSVCDV